MEDAKNDMVTQYDPSKPNTNFFVQIEKGVKIANAANISFTNTQIIAKAYLLVQKMHHTVKNAWIGVAVYQ